DAERAAEGGGDAGARAPRQRGRERIEHTGAGRDDDDQRGEEERQRHGTSLARAAHGTKASRASAPQCAALRVCAHSASRSTSSAAQGFDQDLAPCGNGSGSALPVVTTTSSCGLREVAICASWTPFIRPARLTSVIISASVLENLSSTSSAASAL